MQSSQACGSLIDTACTVAAVHQHYCPSGCPDCEDRLTMEAKTSSHGGCENHDEMDDFQVTIKVENLTDLGVCPGF